MQLERINNNIFKRLGIKILQKIFARFPVKEIIHLFDNIELSQTMSQNDQGWLCDQGRQSLQSEHEPFI